MIIFWLVEPIFHFPELVVKLQFVSTCTLDHLNLVHTLFIYLCIILYFFKTSVPILWKLFDFHCSPNLSFLILFVRHLDFLSVHFNLLVGSLFCHDVVSLKMMFSSTFILNLGVGSWIFVVDQGPWFKHSCVTFVLNRNVKRPLIPLFWQLPNLWKNPTVKGD